MKLLNFARMATLSVAFFSLLHACSSKLEQSGGSETNWIAHCEDDGDCTVGSCVCGVCSKSCTANAACPGGNGPTVCAMGDTNAYRAVCGETSSVSGVCLSDCTTTGCAAGFSCVEGVCAPAAVSVPDGGAPLGATIETHTLATEFLSLGVAPSNERLTGLCLAGAVGEELDDESKCIVVEIPEDGVSCDCEAQGLVQPTSDELARARATMASVAYCGKDGFPPCDTLCGCRSPVLSGAALEACRNDDQAALTAGYCVVSPGRGLGSATITEKCPSDQRTALRYFPGERSVHSVITCSTGHVAEVAVPSAIKAIGDPCTPSDEFRTDFSGYSAQSITVETGTPQCASNVCLVNRFQGRTDCPYGQDEPPKPATCTATGSGDPVTVLVRPQLAERAPETAVYCSCRCDGPGPGPFCQCPTDFTCTPLLDGPVSADVAGSYCVKAGTQVENPIALGNGRECNPDFVMPRPDGCGDP